MGRLVIGLTAGLLFVLTGPGVTWAFGLTPTYLIGLVDGALTALAVVAVVEGALK